MPWLRFQVVYPALAVGRVEVFIQQVDTGWRLAVFIKTAATITKKLPTAAKTWLSTNGFEVGLDRVGRFVLPEALNDGKSV